MKEIADIVQAYQIARKAGIKTALATVVQVDGSSYRRPGARMLITATGELTGAISGGCLEGDALRKALLAINENRNKIVTYDTTDEDDAKFGIQLGCNGIVHILFEPIIDDHINHPIQLLQQSFSERRHAVLVTIFSLTDPKASQPGTCLLNRAGDKSANDNLLPGLRQPVEQESGNVLCYKQSSIKKYLLNQREFTVFFSFIKPVIQLIVAGAGNDVIPLAEIAETMGWNTVIADGRSDRATLQRFPRAQKILVTKPKQLLDQIPVDEQTVFVLMTHNYNYDLELLKLLIGVDTDYIGLLGPKKKMQRMLDELREQGIEINSEQQEKIHGPVGLDIGAETAEEIALSIAAEIKAVLSARNGQSLKIENGPIHERMTRLVS
ncbi:MAG TPA: XdhC family protein [Mucilaginibacter sp.]|jgi:xanthine/CO dehydrogenase XdhC/CoxF family maturation factor